MWYTVYWRYRLFWILKIQRFLLSKPNEWIERQAKENGYKFNKTVTNSTVTNGYDSLANQRIRETRGSTPPLGILTGDNIGERSMGDVVSWSPEFISM